MNVLSCLRSRTSRSPLRICRALEVELHFAAADDAPAVFFVLAALCMNRVAPLSGLSKYRDAHIFHQTCGLVSEIRGLLSLDRKNLLVALHFRESDPIHELAHVPGCRRRSFFLLSMRNPLAFQIHPCRQCRQKQSCRRRPTRILRRFASLHSFSYSEFRRAVLKGCCTLCLIA